MNAKKLRKNKRKVHPKQGIYQKIYRDKYPMKYAYNTLKNNAKRRNKKFTITFEYFKEFAIKVSYLDKKGIYLDSYHIDRIIEEKGYIPGNLQLLKNPENVKKYYKHYHDGKKMVFKTETVKDEINTDAPF